MSRLVPTLRFKEFSGEWEEKTLGDISTNVMYGMNSSAIKYDGEHKYIRITDIDELSRKFLPNPLTSPDGEIEDKYKLKNNDILFARTGASVGKSYIYKEEDGNLYFAGFLIKFNINGANSKFIFLYTLRNYYKKWVSIMSVRSGQPGINAEEYKSLKLNLPTQPKEQQKIANCLSSLDNLIEAQNKKVEALKEHKKGLMQQLFPQEGKNVPELRFDGFSGEWEKKEVNDVFDILAGGDVPKKELSDKKTQEYNIPILSNGIAEKSLYGWTNKAKIDKPSLTISARGTIGWTSLQEKPFFPIVRLIVLTPKIKINLIYSYYYMKKIENDYKYAKVGIPQLTKPMIKNTKLMIPKDSKEQQKIADCLSSLDNLIEAQNKNIEAFKEHKKGLMQQLFVSSEVSA